MTRRDKRQPYSWLPVLIVFMVLAALTIGGLTLYFVENYLIASTGEALALAAADIADKLDRILYERYGDIQVLAQASVVREGDPAAKSKYLVKVKEAYRYYFWLGVTDANGRIVAATDQGSTGKDRGGAQWFIAARDRGGIDVQDVQTFEETGGVLVVAYTAPIIGSRGEFLGAVTTRVSLPALEDVIESTVQALEVQRGASAKVEYQFLTRDGDVIADSFLRQEVGKEAVNLKLLALPSALLSASAKPGYIEEMHIRRRVPVVSGYASTSGYGQFTGLHWAVLVRMDRSNIVAPIRTFLWKLSGAAALVFVPMLAVLLWSTKHLRREWAIAQQEAARAMTAESQGRLIINTALDAVVVMDSQGLIKDWNPQAEKTFGWSRAEAQGRSLSETLIPPQYRDAHNRGLKRFLATGEGPVLNKRIEITALHRQGREFPVELTISPLRSGDTLTFSAFVRDITERKRAEADLQAAKQAAEAATRAKSEFLASMSHEIRTPMNAIIGMADLLAETKVTPEQHHYVQIFRRAGENLLILIDDILDLSKVERGQIHLERRGFDLKSLVDHTMEVFALRAEAKGLELRSRLAPDVPIALVGDSHRLRQVLINLLGNAIKFTERGRITLRVEREDTGPGESMVVRFSVSDTGIGIPADKLDFVFERFTQADSSTTRLYGGTGLGLAICRRLVDLMGGRIWVESQVGEGSTFIFTAPFGVRSEPAVAPVGGPLAGMRVLVVDDLAANRKYLHTLLRLHGAVVTEAADGPEALAEVERALAARTPFDLALLDYRMPGMNGVELAMSLRAKPELAELPLVIISAVSESDAHIRSREVGLAAWLPRPIAEEELLETLTRVLCGRGAETSLTTPSPAAGGRVLLAEDSADNVMLFQAYLKNAPYTLDVAENGAVAVEKFQSSRYDLVLMDMQMPVMDGYTATRAIRQWEREQGRQPTPIIALTANALKGDEEMSLEAGCTAHLTKPIKKAVLLQAIQEHAQGRCSVAEQSGGDL